MISYIVNLFMVQTDLKRNNGYSESFKKKKDILCMCVCYSLSAQKTVSCSQMVVHISL